MPYFTDCVLYDRPCRECGECDRCDLDAGKLCDNCMKCIGMPGLLSGNSDDKTESESLAYRAIRIDGLLTPDEILDDELY